MNKYAQIILAAILFLIIAQILHILFAFAGMSYYMDPAYVSVWSPLMMPAGGALGVEFYMYSILFNFITALFIVGVYSVIKKGIPGKCPVFNPPISKGLWYGFFIFLVSGFSGALGMVLLINLPVGLVAMWAVESLIILLLGGAVVAKIVK